MTQEKMLAANKEQGKTWKQAFYMPAPADRRASLRPALVADRRLAFAELSIAQMHVFMALSSSCMLPERTAFAQRHLLPLLLPCCTTLPPSGFLLA